MFWRFGPHKAYGGWHSFCVSIRGLETKHDHDNIMWEEERRCRPNREDLTNDSRRQFSEEAMLDLSCFARHIKKSQPRDLGGRGATKRQAIPRL